MNQRQYSEMTRVLSALIQTGALNACAVFLFGHCNATEEMADYLIQHGVIPSYILDNNIAKLGSAYRGIQIISPEIVLQYQAGKSIVLIATRFFAEMSAQLQRLGYGGEIVQVVAYNSFVEYSITEETLKRKTDRMLRGAKTLTDIRAGYPSRHLVVCPNSALGDVYWAMAFLPAYCTKHAISEPVVIVAGNGCRQVADLFQASHVVQLTVDEMDELVQAIIFTREENCIIAHHDRPYTDAIIQYLNTRFLSFIDYYRCAVYGLAQNTAPAFPPHAQAFAGDERIVPGKTVIFAPYAKSVAQPPASFWEQLASEWRGKGYQVCTSVHADEQPIRGTMPLALPLNQMKSAAEHAGVFIGLRNGLCDLMLDADCRKIVVFPDCFYSTTPHKAADFFALLGWECTLYP